MGIHWEERGLTFARIERKTPVLRPALQSKQSSLCDLHRSRNRWGGGPNGQIVSVKRAADGTRQRSRKIADEREKSTGPRTDPCGTPQKERPLWFSKTTQARLSERKDWVQRAKQERRPAKMSLWKRVGCQTESKALKKSIVDRIIREPGLGLLNPSEMGWDR